jgi:outer membrane protein OmpA-like peptidoglycan-associated protein
LKLFPIITATVAVALAASGCATKKYVRNSIDPVNSKLDQTRSSLDQTNDNLKGTQATLEKDETALSATNERALAADARAGDALNRAGEAGSKADAAQGRADQAHQRVDQLGNDMSNRIAGLDNYKKADAAIVNFKFNSDKLDMDARQQLDQLAAIRDKYHRYFIAVEGFTDRVGTDAYNAALSRRRADAVVAYLVSQHDIPVYRIQMVGLGKSKPVDDGRGAKANAQNRRVEVTVYTAGGDANASDDAASHPPQQ